MSKEKHTQIAGADVPLNICQDNPGLFWLTSKLRYVPTREYNWLSNQRSYMANSGFGKRLNKVIYNSLNAHRPFNIYQMIIDFGFMVTYYVLNICFEI